MWNTSFIYQGMEKPLSVYVNTFGTGTKSDQEIIKIIKDKFDLTPKGIIEYLKLQKTYIFKHNKLWTLWKTRITMGKSSQTLVWHKNSNLVIINNASFTRVDI